jgi:hypothetical protein
MLPEVSVSLAIVIRSEVNSCSPGHKFGSVCWLSGKEHVKMVVMMSLIRCRHAGGVRQCRTGFHFCEYVDVKVGSL